MKRIIFKYSLDSGMACYVWAFDFAKNGKRIPLLNSNKITAKMSSSIHLNKYDIFKIMSWGHRKQITWRQAQNSIETSPQLLETCIFETFSFIIFSCPILCSFFFILFDFLTSELNMRAKFIDSFSTQTSKSNSFVTNLNSEISCTLCTDFPLVSFTSSFKSGDLCRQNCTQLNWKRQERRNTKNYPEKNCSTSAGKFLSLFSIKTKKRDPLELLGFLLPKNLTLILQLL